MLREGKTGVIYLRVSTEMQVDGFSLDGQRSTIKRFAEREGIIIKGIYEDAGKSGKSIEGRPAFQQMMNEIKAGLEIDYILVYKLSRFGRNAADILTSIEFIQSYDINLIATEEGIDSSQTSGKLLISVLSAVAEIERENIIEQTMNGRKEKARQGGWNGGFAPYGYALVNGELQIVEAEAKTIRKIFELYATSKYGVGGITKMINLTETKKQRQNGTLPVFRDTTVKNILDNPVYIGKIAFGRRTKEKIKGSRNEFKRVQADDYILVEGKHEAIIDNDLWERVREKRKKTGIKTVPNTGYARAHLLSGILRCPVCGGKMHTTKSNIHKDPNSKECYHYYACYNSRYAKGHECTYRRTIREDRIDLYVGILVTELVKSDKFIEAVTERFKIKADTKTIDEEIEKLNENLKKALLNKKELEDDIDNLPIDMPNRSTRRSEMNTRLYELYDRIDLLQEKIEECNAKKVTLSNEELTVENIKLLMNNFNEIYDVISNDERQQLIRYLFNKIEIYPDWENERMIKSVELNFRIHNNQVAVNNILNNDSKDIILNKLMNTSYSSNVGLTFDLEECDLLIPIYEKVKEVFLRQVKPRCKKRGPYKTGPKYSDIIAYVKETFNMKIYGSQIAKVRKRYGIAVHGANYFKLTSYPKYEVEEAIRKALIHFGSLTEESEPIKEIDIDKNGNVRPLHYKKAHATYKEIIGYIFETYGYKVHTANIAQIKREFGVSMINVRTKEDAKHPGIPKEKRQAIIEALYHFRIIDEMNN